MKTLVFQFATLTDVTWQMSGEVVLMTLVGGLGTVFVFAAGNGKMVVNGRNVGDEYFAAGGAIERVAGARQSTEGEARVVAVLQRDHAGARNSVS